MFDLLTWIGEEAPWIGIVMGFVSIGLFFGMRTTYLKINGYAEGFRKEVLEMRKECGNRKSLCDAHLEDVLEMRRKLFTEVMTASVAGIKDQLDEHHRMILEVLKKRN